MIYLQILNSEKERVQFQKVYEDNYILMYHIAFGILHHKEDGENAVHDAFLSLSENFEKYTGLSGREISALCVTVVKNKCMDILRRQKHYSDKELEDLVICDESLVVSPEKMALYSEKERQAVCLLEHLPEIYKEVMILKYYYAYSVKEIAGMTGVSAKTVDQRLFRAKKKIRRLLDDEERNGR